MSWIYTAKAATLTSNERGKKVFEQLAKEEREHAGHFFEIYTGSDLGSFEDFMAMPLSKGHAMLKPLEKALDENVHERKAMELVMKEEEDGKKSANDGILYRRPFSACRIRADGQVDREPLCDY